MEREEGASQEVGWGGRLAQAGGVLGSKSSWRNRLRPEEKGEWRRRLRNPDVGKGCKSGTAGEERREGARMKFQGLLQRHRVSWKWEGSEQTGVAAVGLGGGRKGGGRGRKEEIQDFTHTKERLAGLAKWGGRGGSAPAGRARDFKPGTGPLVCPAWA